MRYAFLLAPLAGLGVCLANASPTSAGPLPGPSLERSLSDDGIVIRIQSRRRVRRFLEDQGFEFLEFVDRDPPVTFVEGCKNDREYMVMFDRDGRYVGHRTLGDCDRSDDVGDDLGGDRRTIRELLRDRGYTNVKFLPSSRDRYLVEACRRGRKYELTLDLRGDVRDRVNLGRCRDDNDDGDDGDNGGREMSDRALRSSLRRRGYRRIRFRRDSNGVRRAVACQGIRQYSMRFDRRGLIDERRIVDFCNIGDQDVEFVPPRPLPNVDADSDEPLHPETCQEILSHLQYRTPIVFEEGKARIRRESRPLIRTIAENFRRCPGARLMIEGHTDDTGSAARNLRLSRERAQAVHDMLIDLGTPRRLLEARGYGLRHPIVSNDTEEGRKRNRRIDLVLEWRRRERRSQDR